MDTDESLERALADLEIVQAAYPEETARRLTDQDDSDEGQGGRFPLVVVFGLSDTAHMELELSEGYPVDRNVQVRSYRSAPREKARMETALSAVRTKAAECLAEGMEGGLACCAAALEAWNEFEDKDGRRMPENASMVETSAATSSAPDSRATSSRKPFRWRTGEPLVDRKSSFQAHICRITSESDVREAVSQLLNSSTKLQRATHNMYAYRLLEVPENGEDAVLKYDNDDDGEHGAGSRLSHLLEMRKEDGVLVVVSRWFGGIHLGPKRFVHISNVARDLLAACHESGWDASSS